MSISLELKNRIENEAMKYEISDLVFASQNITNLYKNNSGKNERLLKSEVDVLAYAIVRMPATYGSLEFSLKKMLENINDDITSVIDIGSGTGTSYFALNYLLNSVKLTCLEREPEMVKFAKNIIDDSNVEFINCDVVKEFPNTKADLILSSYLVNELDEESCFKLLDKMIESSNKYILIVDPGTPESFKRMKKIREYFLKKGLSIIAPCQHQLSCPIKEDDWCHFAVRVSRSKLHKQLKGADVPYEDEKFSFLAVSKAPINNEGSRVLRHPMINPGMVKLIICNKEGNIENVTVTKKNKEQFKAAKKLSAGDKYNI